MSDAFVILHDNGRNEYDSKEQAIKKAKGIIKRYYDGQHITLFIAEIKASVTTQPEVEIRVTDY